MTSGDQELSPTKPGKGGDLLYIVTNLCKTNSVAPPPSPTSTVMTEGLPSSFSTTSYRMLSLLSMSFVS